MPVRRSKTTSPAHPAPRQGQSRHPRRNARGRGRQTAAPVTLHNVRQEALTAWPAIRGVLAGWLKSRSLSHQVAAVDRLMKAMTLGLAWEPAQRPHGVTLVIQLAGPQGGTLTLPLGQAEAHGGREQAALEASEGAMPHGPHKAIPPEG